MNLIDKFLLIAIMTTSFLFHGQVNRAPWSVSFGLNAIDTRISAGGDGSFLENRLSQPISIMTNWNANSPFYFGLEREVFNNFSLGLEASTNRISKFVTFENGQYKTSNPGNLRYFGLDGVAKYSFMSLIGSKVIDPNLTFGAGVTSLESLKYVHGNLGVKINFWLTNALAITAGTTYKFGQRFGNLRSSGGQPVEPSYLQHTLGLTYNFGLKDADKDGVPDKIDNCPYAKGLIELKGCPDSDGDGVSDSDDNCPLVKGTVELKGCPDKDNDGVADDEDACPDKSGDKLLKGCPDSDKDGVADSEDKCPNQSGDRDNNGCPLPDTDKDGVPDKFDKCPNEAGSVSNKGCVDNKKIKNNNQDSINQAGINKPEANLDPINQDVIEQLNKYSQQILFNSGKSLFKDKSVSALESILLILKTSPNAKIIVEGHADSVGNYKSNLALSKKRANMVKQYLIDNGIDPDRLSIVGMSESDPVASNKTAIGRSLNRRVEVKFVK